MKMNVLDGSAVSPVELIRLHLGIGVAAAVANDGETRKVRAGRASSRDIYRLPYRLD